MTRLDNRKLGFQLKRRFRAKLSSFEGDSGNNIISQVEEDWRRGSV